MKQNSRIMFHRIHKLFADGSLRNSKLVGMALILCFCGFSTTADASPAGDKAEYPASFDPAKGFTPAQSDLTAVFLQIAGSLEAYGSPEPYLRHMQAEHARIEAKYRQQLGDKPRSFCPAYMDATYFERFAANWKRIAPQLGLESLAKSTGHLMRAAINGTDGKGTILVDAFNAHQHQVYVALTSKKTEPVPGFDRLQADLLKCLRLDRTPASAENLTAEQQAVANPTRDIQAAFLKLFSALDAALSAADAAKVKAVVLGIVTDVGHMAQSEIEVAVVEDSLDELRSPRSPYSAEQETALNTAEQKTFAEFLRKARFTRADFPALDKFYSTIYDKLTERGKKEMHYRIQAGMRPAD